VWQSLFPHAILTMPRSIYYHFCLLSLFRPFFDLPTVYGAQVFPREICDQAAHAIISLTQTYGRLYTLRRISGFVPYFVYAASIVLMAVDAGGPSNAQNSVSASEASRATPSGGAPNMLGVASYPKETKTISSSHVLDARLLLADMGSTHKFAAEAGRKIWDRINAAERKRAP